MCVEWRGLPWERPAVPADFAVLERHFDKVDFAGALEAMSVWGFTPLATDLVLVAGLMSGAEDDFGFRHVPFAGLDLVSGTIVKTLDMDGIVDWFENTALGSEMWASVSRWTGRVYGQGLAFAMNCGCALFPNRARTDGRLEAWTRRFNESRRNVVGRTTIKIRNSVFGTDITEEQAVMWRRMRDALQALPARQEARHAA